MSYATKTACQGHVKWRIEVHNILSAKILGIIVEDTSRISNFEKYFGGEHMLLSSSNPLLRESAGHDTIRTLVFSSDAACNLDQE